MIIEVRVTVHKGKHAVGTPANVVVDTDDNEVVIHHENQQWIVSAEEFVKMADIVREFLEL